MSEMELQLFWMPNVALWLCSEEGWVVRNRACGWGSGRPHARLQGGGMTVIARADRDGKGVTRAHLTLHRTAGIVPRTHQVAIYAVDTGSCLAVDGMGRILGLVLVTVGAEGVSIVSRADFLRMDLVARRASYVRLAVPA